MGVMEAACNSSRCNNLSVKEKEKKKRQEETAFNVQAVKKKQQFSKAELLWSQHQCNCIDEHKANNNKNVCMENEESFCKRAVEVCNTKVCLCT